MNQILLPGSNKQINFLLDRITLDELNLLVIGSQSVDIAKTLADKASMDVELIVEDYETLMISNLELDKKKNVNIKLMDFERTDFSSGQFDLIFSQASITNFNRKKVIKEIKRILKPSGFLCVGEIVKLHQNVPTFINEIFNSSNLHPLQIDELEKYYCERNFILIDSIDLSKTLAKFYQDYAILLNSKSKNLSESEKSFYKKILSKISHESNVYLKLGGEKYIGFKVLLLKKQ